MPAVFDTIGIQTITAALCESVELTRSLEEADALASDSGHGYAEAFNPTYELSASGKGDLPAAAVLGSSGDPTVVSNLISGGITVITGIKESENQSDVNGWEVSGKNAPAAVAAGTVV